MGSSFSITFFMESQWFVMHSKVLVKYSSGKLLHKKLGAAFKFFHSQCNVCLLTKQALGQFALCHLQTLWFPLIFLAGRLKYLTLTDPTKVWMPDTFFRNEKEARKHEIIVPNVYVRIFPDGEILYSIR